RPATLERRAQRIGLRGLLRLELGDQRLERHRGVALLVERAGGGGGGGSQLVGCTSPIPGRTSSTATLSKPSPTPIGGLSVPSSSTSRLAFVSSGHSPE